MLLDMADDGAESDTPSALTSLPMGRRTLPLAVFRRPGLPRYDALRSPTVRRFNVSSVGNTGLRPLEETRLQVGEEFNGDGSCGDGILVGLEYKQPERPTQQSGTTAVS